MLVEAEGSCDSVGWFARQQQMKREGKGMNWREQPASMPLQFVNIKACKMIVKQRCLE